VAAERLHVRGLPPAVPQAVGSGRGVARTDAAGPGGRRRRGHRSSVTALRQDLRHGGVAHDEDAPPEPRIRVSGRPPGDRKDRSDNVVPR
jgi:hypothetical protein